jgi:hypothetical protein
MPEWPATAVAETQQLEIELSAARAETEFLQESLADVELALEDRGWIALSIQASREFTREGRRRAAALARILAIQNPLVKRGLAIRAGYIWGRGVTITAADPDVNHVLQLFLDDNRQSFSGSQAREEGEKTLGTDGDVFRALPTSPLTGRVQVRTIDPCEIDQIICNPDDRDEPWFYLRRYVAQDAGVRYAGLINGQAADRAVLYPALGFKPSARMKSIDGFEVMWDTPVQHVAVNRVDGWSFGIGDAYASIAWARGYKEFLDDWSKLTKSLARYAWRITAPKKSQAQNAATKARDAALRAPVLGSEAGATAAMASANLEAIPKSGATIDSQSGRPLAAMVAAALGVPVTMLLADPGVTGARATAETLDAPTKNEMTMRRSLWADKDHELFDYVIDQAVKAPKGPLKGTVAFDEYGREIILLANDADRAINIDWPSLDDVDVKVLVDAIVAADGTGKVPPLTIARLILQALGVDDIDDVLEEITDADGNFIDPDASAGDQAIKAFRNGEDPAAVI